MGFELLLIYISIINAKLKSIALAVKDVPLFALLGNCNF
jgi:hypothetical protein